MAKLHSKAGLAMGLFNGAWKWVREEAVSLLRSTAFMALLGGVMTVLIIVLSEIASLSGWELFARGMSIAALFACVLAAAVAIRSVEYRKPGYFLLAVAVVTAAFSIFRIAPTLLKIVREYQGEDVGLVSDTPTIAARVPYFSSGEVRTLATAIDDEWRRTTEPAAKVLIMYLPAREADADEFMALFDNAFWPSEKKPFNQFHGPGVFVHYFRETPYATAGDAFCRRMDAIRPDVKCKKLPVSKKPPGADWVIWIGPEK